MMFAVIFEAQPNPKQFDAYVEIAKSLRPELETVEGFLENIRYKSLNRPGWILSLSIWRDERALVRWRTRATHHRAQEQGREGILQEYHLRVGQVSTPSNDDSVKPSNHEGKTHLASSRPDSTEVGRAKCIVFVTVPKAEEHDVQRGDKMQGLGVDEIARRMGLRAKDGDAGLVEWDLFSALLDPADHLLLTSWNEQQHAVSFMEQDESRGHIEYRRVDIVRDYGKYDRREAPQYYKDAPGAHTLH